VITEE